MHISVATANFYYLPFQQALDLIAAAGFQYIKIDLYWQHGEWAMAQHLQDIPTRQAVQVIRRAGLTVSSIHDGGGVIHDAHCTRGLINPELSAYLDEYAIWLNSPLLEK